MKRYKKLLENSGTTHAHGVSIGDKFIPYNDKRKDVYTVIDIYTVINSKGAVVEYQCITEHEVGSQKIKNQTPFATIIRSGILK